MRSRGKSDANQTEIVKALRKEGYSVAVTSCLGAGFPDIIVGARGINFLIEIKNPSVPYADRQLTSDQEKWHAAWRGKSYVVETIGQCLSIIKNETWAR